MAKGFWQSKLSFWGMILLGAVLSVLLWIRDQGYPIYIPILLLCRTGDQQSGS